MEGNFLCVFQVCRWTVEHVLQCCGPSRRERPWRPARHHLRQSSDRNQTDHHLQGTSGAGDALLSGFHIIYQTLQLNQPHVQLVGQDHVVNMNFGA